MSASTFGPLRAVFFDLDGTLVDTLDDLADSVNFALGRLGRSARGRDEIRGFIGDGVRQLLKDCLGPEHESLAGKALALFTPHYLDHCTDKSVLYPGVAEGLERLSRRYLLGVVTNKPEAPSRKIFEKLGIWGRFKVLIAGDTLAVKKPLPEPVLEAARRLNVHPAQTVLVGDNGGDMESARGAGAGALGVTFGYRPAEALKAAGAQALADNFPDAVSILEAENV